MAPHPSTTKDREIQIDNGFYFHLLEVGDSARFGGIVSIKLKMYAIFKHSRHNYCIF